MACDSNILKKIYPKPDYNYDKLNYDKVGLWSITRPDEADIISSTIINLLSLDIKILDMTAGCGGNTISFCKHFNNVVAIECDPDRFEILKNNLSCYDFNNYTIVCGDSLDYIESKESIDSKDYINLKKDSKDYIESKESIDSYDVYFIDPPWGGPSYKQLDSIELVLSNIKLNDIVEMIPLNKLVVLKLPFNYNIDSFNKFTILKKLEMKNIIILFLIRLTIE